MLKNNVVCHYVSVVDEHFTNFYSEYEANVNGLFYRCRYTDYYAYIWKNS